MARPARPTADDTAEGERCPPHLVESLEGMGFNRADVERWTGRKARHVLGKYRRDTGIATARAEAAAGRIDGIAFPPPQSERLEAARWVGTALGAADEHELLLAVEYGVSQLASDELHRLASHLIQRLKTVPELPQSAPLFTAPTATTTPARSDARPAAPQHADTVPL